MQYEQFTFNQAFWAIGSYYYDALPYSMPLLTEKILNIHLELQKSLLSTNKIEEDIYTQRNQKNSYSELEILMKSNDSLIKMKNEVSYVAIWMAENGYLQKFQSDDGIKYRATDKIFQTPLFNANTSPRPGGSRRRH